MNKDDKLLEVSMMLGDAIEKLNNLSAYKEDPYRELREAQERGETIQARLKCSGYEWKDVFVGVHEIPDFQGSQMFFSKDNEYRIKPKTKKLYQWAFTLQDDKGWSIDDLFYETEKQAQNGTGCSNVMRLDSTMIEVEDV